MSAFNRLDTTQQWPEPRKHIKLHQAGFLQVLRFGKAAEKCESLNEWTVSSVRRGCVRRQIFHKQMHRSTSCPTRASPGCTGREGRRRPRLRLAGIEHGNKEMWSSVTKHPLLWDYVVLPHFQECDPVIGGSPLSCGLDGLYIQDVWSRTRACVELDEVRIHQAAGGAFSTSLEHSRAITMMDLAVQVKVRRTTEAAAFPDMRKDSMRLLNSPPWPSIWECEGRSWLDWMSGQNVHTPVGWLAGADVQQIISDDHLLHSKDVFPPVLRVKKSNERHSNTSHAENNRPCYHLLNASQTTFPHEASFGEYNHT